jgi:aspartyl-tRNA(Asn)/glutamyl-tRNA(Gln) amidotransferase subunit A
VDAFYGRATAVRRALRREFAERFRGLDLVLLPTAPTTAFRLGEKSGDPLAMYLADVFTVFANLTGFPALSVPFGADAAGLPIGVQLLAPPWREDLLFGGARALAGDPLPAPPLEAR